jgi:hypothetical protein
LRHQRARPAAGKSEDVQRAFLGAPLIVPGCRFVDAVGDERKHTHAKAGAENDYRQFAKKDEHGDSGEIAGRRKVRAHSCVLGWGACNPVANESDVVGAQLTFLVDGQFVGDNIVYFRAGCVSGERLDMDKYMRPAIAWRDKAKSLRIFPGCDLSLAADRFPATHHCHSCFLNETDCRAECRAEYSDFPYEIIHQSNGRGCRLLAMMRAC